MAVQLYDLYDQLTALTHWKEVDLKQRKFGRSVCFPDLLPWLTGQNFCIVLAVFAQVQASDPTAVLPITSLSRQTIEINEKLTESSQLLERKWTVFDSIMKTNLIIEPVPESRHQEFIDFFYRDFFPREPLALASGLAGKTNPKTKETFAGWLRDGVSLVIIDPESNQIVAGALNCLLKKTEILFDPDYSCMEKEDRVIWKFLDHLDTAYDPFDRLQVDCGMELVFLCVRDSHAGQGLARRLAEETIATAGRLGIPFIKSNPSTPGKIQLSSMY